MLRRTLAVAALAAACILPHGKPALADNVLQFGPVVPYDVNTADPAAKTQRDAFNLFAWRTFVALNWPADLSGDRRGVADPKAPLGAEGPRVWETWKGTTDLFSAAGNQPEWVPTEWNDWTPFPGQCAAAEKGQRVLPHAGKLDPTLPATVQPMSTDNGYLVDQNGKLVYIDVLMNQAAYDFIYSHKYFDSRYQQAAGGNITFTPVGDNAIGTYGPINVKPSWKVMGPGDDPSQFYTRDAFDMKCNPLKVGLVGFHIGVKTKSAPQWIWATFEHRNNAPSCQAWTGDPRQTCMVNWTQPVWSFANQSCKLANGAPCPINKLPAGPDSTTPVQVVRIIPIPDDVEAWNARAAGELKGQGPWANYVLVDTQYPLEPKSVYGSPSPTVLANTTLETYNQGTTAWNQTSSCLGCHYLAPTASQNFTPPQPQGSTLTDFDFQMFKARVFQAVPPPAK